MGLKGEVCFIEFEAAVKLEEGKTHMIRPLLLMVITISSVTACKQLPVREETLSVEEGLSPVDGIKFLARMISLFTRLSKNVELLHQNISNTQRIDIIKEVPIGEILCAPGHLSLRNPSAVIEMAKQISQAADGGKNFVKGKEKIVLNVFTTTQKNFVGEPEIVIRSIEVMDGNHRLAAGLLALDENAKDLLSAGLLGKQGGKPVWQKIGDIPQEALEVRVNGYRALGGGKLRRWIPLKIFNDPSCTGPCLELKQGKRGHFKIIQDDRGNQAVEVSGGVSSIDETIPVKYMGRRLTEVLQATLKSQSN